MRLLIRGYLPSWAGQLRRSSNQSSSTEEDGFVSQITISDVRREIARASGYSPAQTAPSTALVGRIFHEVLADH